MSPRLVRAAVYAADASGREHADAGVRRPGTASPRRSSRRKASAARWRSRSRVRSSCGGARGCVRVRAPRCPTRATPSSTAVIAGTAPCALIASRQPASAVRVRRAGQAEVREDRGLERDDRAIGCADRVGDLVDTIADRRRGTIVDISVSDGAGRLSARERRGGARRAPPRRGRRRASCQQEPAGERIARAGGVDDVARQGARGLVVARPSVITTVGSPPALMTVTPQPEHGFVVGEAQAHGVRRDCRRRRRGAARRRAGEASDAERATTATSTTRRC